MCKGTVCVLICLAVQVVSAEEPVKSCKGPGAATFSRARQRLDALLMMSRRLHWRENGFGNHFISLGF